MSLATLYDVAVNLYNLLSGMVSGSSAPMSISDVHNRETILAKDHLIAGATGGLAQAILCSIVTIPVVNTDTFVIKWAGGTETWTFKAARSGAGEVAIGATAATAQTNLIAAINADSSRYAAVATTGLGGYFAGGYTTQFVVYRRSVSGLNAANRIYGTQTTAAGIKVVAFSTTGYHTLDATESNIPATDPGARTFGLARSVDQIWPGEEHLSANDGLSYFWNRNTYVWRPYKFPVDTELTATIDPAGLATSAKQDTLAGVVALEATQLLARKAVAPSLGTIVYFAISGTSADSGTISTAGTYELECDVACWYRVNSATGGSAAVVETAPARLLMAGERRQVAVAANGAIVAITSGGTGVLGYSLVS